MEIDYINGRFPACPFHDILSCGIAVKLRKQERNRYERIQ